MKTIQSIKDIIRAPFAWPGGYAKILLMSDGEVICKGCAQDNYKLILRATREKDRSGWQAEGVFIHWEGAPLYCANCGCELQSEYGDPEQESAA